MRLPLVALAAVLAGCGSPDAGPPVAPSPRAERFEVPVLSCMLYAEIRPLERPAPGEPVRAEVRICRGDGTDAGAVFGVAQPGPAWTGALSDRETKIEFDRLMAAPGVPAPLNVVVLWVKASVANAGKATFDVRSTAMCVR